MKRLNLLNAIKRIKLTTTLASKNVYGLGERHGKLKVDVNWNRFSFWARDQIPVKDGNLYGDHPFYMVTETNGQAYGVLFLNSNAKDAELQPLPSITWRSIGGWWCFPLLNIIFAHSIDGLRITLFYYII